MVRSRIGSNWVFQCGSVWERADKGGGGMIQERKVDASVGKGVGRGVSKRVRGGGVLGGERECAKRNVD